MKKRIAAIVLGVVMIFALGFTACWNPNTGGTGNNPPPDPTAPDINVIINQAYGRGIEGSDTLLNESPISHSFVELYNRGTDDANIAGYSLYAGYNTSKGSYWNGQLRLSGVIPAGHSFLIAVKQTTAATAPRYTITAEMMDMEWPGSAFSTGGSGNNVRVGFNNKNLKILLRRSDAALNPLTEQDPFVCNGGDKISGYIDMVSMSANDFLLEADRDAADAYEGGNGTVASQSRNKAMRRKNFTDSNDSYADLRAIDYRSAHLSNEGLELVRPRCLADGAWGSDNGFDARPDHIIINQIYGKSTETDSALSNSFIELYNPTGANVSLNGKSLQFSSGGAAWEMLSFGADDIIPANSSFLVVFSANRNDNAYRQISVSASDVDRFWPTVALPNQNLKVALMNSAVPLAVVNPSADDSVKENCLDFIGITGSNYNDSGSPLFGVNIDACEGTGTKIGLSKQKSIRRKFFLDTDNNIDDLEFIDFREYNGDEDDGITDARLYDPLLGSFPKCRQDGAWGSIVK